MVTMTNPEWVPLPKYIKDHKPICDMRWLVLHRKSEMLNNGCLMKLGNRLFVEHDRLMNFLELFSKTGESISSGRSVDLTKEVA